jgi:hypothetical protein
MANGSNGHRRESSPDAIGFENDLYRPDDLEPGEDPESYENQFRDFEGKAEPGHPANHREPCAPRRRGRSRSSLQLHRLSSTLARRTRRVVAAPRERAAEIIIGILESDRKLYESEARRSGVDLNEFPFERIQRTKRMYKPRLTAEGFIEGAMAMMNAILKYLHSRTWTVLYRNGQASRSLYRIILSCSNGRTRAANDSRRDTRTSIRNSRSR